MLLRCSDVIYLIMWYCWYITTWGQIKHKQENIFTDVRFYRWKLKYNDTYDIYQQLLNLPNNVWRLIVFAPFLIKSSKQSLGDLLFLLRFLLLSLPNNVWRLIVFAPFLIIIFIIIILILSFRKTWTCPRQISGTTGQNFMKLGGVIDICF